MILKKIKGYNYRNYHEIELNFDPNINLLIGDNGAGKTTILEIIFFLSNLKSHRTNYNSDLIKKNEEKSLIEGKFLKDEIIENIKVELDNDKKKIMMDGKITPRQKVISNIYTIIFSPLDLEIIKGGPQVRRNYLDDQLKQLHFNYFKTIDEYEKILKQRNILLKQILYQDSQNNQLLAVLTEKLIEKAEKIYKYRKNYIENINTNASNIFWDINEEKGFRIEYLTSVCLKDETIIIEKLKEKFKEKEQEEKEKGITLVGPHRDDFNFMLKTNNLKNFGSQGQQRLSVIVLKLAEIPIFSKKTNTFPILLLDDIFSELDSVRKNKLLKYISPEIQTIITTTDLSNIDEKLTAKAKIFKIKNSTIEEVEHEL